MVDFMNEYKAVDFMNVYKKYKVAYDKFGWNGVMTEFQMKCFRAIREAGLAHAAETEALTALLRALHTAGEAAATAHYEAAKAVAKAKAEEYRMLGEEQELAREA